jgi:hypothetical protein
LAVKCDRVAATKRAEGARRGARTK